MATITRNNIVTMAFEYLEISGLTSNPLPRDNALALRSLEAMMISWNNLSLYLGWQAASDITSPDGQDDTGLSDTAYEAVYINLAVRLAAPFGKVPTQIKELASELKSALYSVELPQYEANPYMPVGSGNRIDSHSSDFQYSEEYLTVENNGDLDGLTTS